MQDLLFGELLSANFVVTIYKYQFSKSFYGYYYIITGKDTIPVGTKKDGSVAELVAEAFKIIEERDLYVQYIRWESKDGTNKWS